MVLFINHKGAASTAVETGDRMFVVPLGFSFAKTLAKCRVDTQGAPSPKSYISHSAITPTFLIVTTY